MRLLAQHNACAGNAQAKTMATAYENLKNLKHLSFDDFVLLTMSCRTALSLTLRLAAHNRWQFLARGQTVVHEVRGQVRVNSSAAVVFLALAGAGIGHINDVVGQQLVMRGKLVPVLACYSASEQYPVYTAILAEQHRAPKIRATMGFLVLCFADFKPG